MAWYLDTSAFLKLALQEPRSTELRAWAEAEEERSGSLWSSDLLLTEAVRTARRVSTEALKATMDRLQRIAIVAITTDTYVSIETVIYDLRQNKLVWAGQTKTMNPSDVESFVGELADAVSRELRASGMVARK